MSLPLRECGLKQPVADALSAYIKSLPLRECGLKLHRADKGKFCSASLPLRECGLKQELIVESVGHFLVTPLAGVWIETGRYRFFLCLLMRHSPCGSVD